MELTLDQALQHAVAAHNQGELKEAERFYLAILQAEPNHPDANHNLGVLTVSAGRPLDAIPLFKLALQANPKVEQFWLSYIEVLMTLQRIVEAERVLADAKQAGVSADKLEAVCQQAQSVPRNKNKKGKKGLTVSEKRKRLAEKKRAERWRNKMCH